MSGIKNEEIIEGTDFTGAKLDGQLFWGLDLRGVNFSDASLVDAKFIACDIRGTIFSGANMSGVDMSGSVYRSKDRPPHSTETDEQYEERIKQILIHSREKFKLSSYRDD